MKKASYVFSMVMTVLILCCSTASAEIRPRTFSVTPYIGGYTFEGNEDLDTSPVFGLRLGYDFTKNWGVEGAADYLRTDFTRNDPSNKVDIYGYRLEAVYNFWPEGKLVPFVAAGFGGRNTNYKNLPNDRNFLLGDYGAGVKYFLSDNWALRGDIRHLILTNDTLNNLEYTIGLSYYFGKPKPVQAAVPPPPPPLAAPLNLRATPKSDSQIDVGWNGVDEATGYKIYRDGSYLTSSRTAALPDRGLKASTQYCYRVTATDQAGRESEKSNEACATTAAPPALPAPLNLQAKPQSDSLIDLGWNAVKGATGYKIYRDGPYLTDSPRANAPDAGLKASTQYCYRVTAIDKSGKESAKSNEACATTLAPPALPAPLNLKATPESDSQINLDWNAVKGATGYKIYRDGPYLAASPKANAPDRGLKASTRYCYRVTATDKAGKESEKSNEACATTAAPPVVKEQKRESAVAREMFEKGRATINIEFDTNKANIKPKYHEEIKKFADVMQDHPDLNVIIEGHTDNVGAKAYNEKLSQRRAESVKKYMVDKFGISAERLSAKGYGMSKPLTGNNTAAGRAKNRRVEAAVDYQIKK